MTDHKVAEIINAAGIVAAVVFGFILGGFGLAIWLGWV